MADMSQMEGKVVRQIEYYFGDHNLPRDKFLKEQLQLDDGWVSVSTMLLFNRLKCLTTDSKVIIEALQKSKTGLLEISDDKTKIRRSPSKPLPEFNEDYKDALKNKSVYIKGFPLTTTLDEILEWLTGKGHSENVQMRRNLQKQFKGSVFLSFESEEASKTFLGRDDIKSFKDNELLVLSREAYHAKKAEERKLHKAESKAKAKHNKDEQQKQTEDNDMDTLLEERAGCLLKFSGELDQVSREDFHTLFSGHGKIKWVDFTRGAKEGNLLFDGKAKEALDVATEANGGSLQIKGSDVTWELLEGDEEKDTLRKMIQAQQESFRNKGRGRERFGGGRGRGGGRRGGGGRGRGGRDQNRSHFQGKKTKFDSDNEDEGAQSPKKRNREEAGTDAPAAKVIKTENLEAGTDAPAAKVIKTENGS